MRAGENAARGGHDTTPTGWSYLLAVLLPILGLILAVVALARGHVGPGLALVLTSVLGWCCAVAVLYG